MVGPTAQHSHGVQGKNISVYFGATPWERMGGTEVGTCSGLHILRPFSLTIKWMWYQDNMERCRPRGDHGEAGELGIYRFPWIFKIMKFWEELIAYFPSVWHGPHTKRRLQHGNVLPSRCLATIRDVHTDTETDGRHLLCMPLRWAQVA
jgi:hypothetical protein